MTRLVENAYVTSQQSNVWRACAGCQALAPLPPEERYCHQCRPATPPVRIQRRRARGWRMPLGAVYVGRPTRFGNPFPASYFGAAEAVSLYRQWLAGADHLGYPNANQLRQQVLDGLPLLAGRDLACWCPLEDEHGNRVPCHADVLLALANGLPEVTR